MEAWSLESQPGKQMGLAWGSAAVGLVLLWGFRHFEGPGLTNSLAGFLLGVLLMGIGVWGFLVSGKQILVVDPGTRRILVQDTNRFGSKTRTIPFEDIGTITLGYLGKKTNAVTFYYLVLHLRNGQQVSLLTPGRFFEGTTDRAVMEGWRQRLEAILDNGSRSPIN